MISIITIVAIIVVIYLVYQYVFPPQRTCYEAKGIRLMGGGFAAGGDADQGKNYGANVGYDDCKKACFDDPDCKQYVWYKDNHCYPMKNEYGVNKDSFDAGFTSGYCNSYGKMPPTSL